jgi:hypothetical protein
MRIDNIPFGTTDWQSVAPTTHKGDRASPPGAPGSSADTRAAR